MYHPQCSNNGARRILQFAFCVTVLAFVGVPQSSAQDTAAKDSTGLPGDNFSLQGALDLFKKANSPEEFEKLLNTEDNHVNNLDLNGDGDIDYVRVVGKTEKDAHAFVLQVPVSEKESQDIAVIELEKAGPENATIQILGDEDIYGEQTIVEPGEGDEDEEVKEEGDGGGPYVGEYSLENFTSMRVVVNVWVGWPCVRFVYAPTYRVWVSPVEMGFVPGMVAPMASACMAGVSSIQSSTPRRLCSCAYASRCSCPSDLWTSKGFVGDCKDTARRFCDSLPDDENCNRQNETRRGKSEDDKNNDESEKGKTLRHVFAI